MRPLPFDAASPSLHLPCALPTLPCPAGGTHSAANEFKCWVMQSNLANMVVENRVSQRLYTEMCNLARELNAHRLRLADPKNCPYVHGCGADDVMPLEPED